MREKYTSVGCPRVLKSDMPEQQISHVPCNDLTEAYFSLKKTLEGFKHYQRLSSVKGPKTAFRT